MDTMKEVGEGFMLRDTHPLKRLDPGEESTCIQGTNRNRTRLLKMDEVSDMCRMTAPMVRAGSLVNSGFTNIHCNGRRLYFIVTGKERAGGWN